MARIFITGSADGLGRLAAVSLIEKGHDVVLHARNVKRADVLLQKVRGAKAVLTADLSNIAETVRLAADVNTMGNL